MNGQIKDGVDSQQQQQQQRRRDLPFGNENTLSLGLFTAAFVQRDGTVLVADYGTKQNGRSRQQTYSLPEKLRATRISHALERGSEYSVNGQFVWVVSDAKPTARIFLIDHPKKTMVEYSPSQNNIDVKEIVQIVDNTILTAGGEAIAFCPGKKMWQKMHKGISAIREHKQTYAANTDVLAHFEIKNSDRTTSASASHYVDGSVWIEPSKIEHRNIDLLRATAKNFWGLTANGDVIKLTTGNTEPLAKNVSFFHARSKPTGEEEIISVLFRDNTFQVFTT